MIIFALLALPFLAAQPEAHTRFTAKTSSFGKSMMVSSANPIASQVGYTILEKGGHAIDAALAMQMVLTLVEPHASGIGGGGLLLYYGKKKGEVIAYDGRETAPQAIETTRIPDIVGGKAVGTPGVLKMLEMAHQEQGVLPWKALFEPAIQLAQEGFTITPRLHKLIQKTPGLTSFQQTRDYLFEKGKAKPAGTRLKNVPLAQTFRLLADHGTDPFYKGEIAQKIVDAVQPGALSLEDLAAYRPVKRKPIESIYRRYRVCGFPPPSMGGIAVAQILGMLSETDLSAYTIGNPSFINLFCRASRAAYADRQLFGGDPAFTNVPVDLMLSPTYLHHLLENPNKTPIAAVEHPSTSQICVIDGEGNAVSLTTSLENAFGSTVMAGGFFLNNQVTDFSTGPNRIEPRKRPMSSMAPTFIFDGEDLILVVGSAGGARIIDYVSQAIVGVLDFGMTIQAAISFPNYTSIVDTIDLEEETFLKKQIPALQKMGNRMRVIHLTSGTQGIQQTPFYLIGGVDPRREGVAMGD
ncbi:MAG: Glutathione hydrolase proenzyme [Chlamydiales bacterium]|nr:Glutathione hydrolase proenzyme [Chlamydiales bacterium]